MTNIIVTSKNRKKIESVKKAFENYYPNIIVVGTKSESDVSTQPVNQEVFLGAKNRINNLKQSQNLSNYNFIVSCEGGIINQFGIWFNVQVVLIEDLISGKKGSGISAGTPIPDRYINEIIQNSFAKISDKIFDGKGGIGTLTRNIFSREYLIFEATIMAITQIINIDWEEKNIKW